MSKAVNSLAFAMGYKTFSNHFTIDIRVLYNINMEYKSNQKVVYSCKYHVVWCPKYRRKVLTGTIEARLKEVLIETSASVKIDIIEMDILPDHVHLLLEVDPQYGIHKAIKHLKGRSSFVLRNEFKELTTKLPTLWSNSYFVSTVGGTPFDAIKKYIENQKNS